MSTENETPKKSRPQGGHGGNPRTHAQRARHAARQKEQRRDMEVYRLNVVEWPLLMTPTEFAALCNVSMRTLGVWRKKGNCPPLTILSHDADIKTGRKVFTSVRYARDDVLAWLAERKYVGRQPLNEKLREGREKYLAQKHEEVRKRRLMERGIQDNRPPEEEDEYKPEPAPAKGLPAHLAFRK